MTGSLRDSFGSDAPHRALPCCPHAVRAWLGWPPPLCVAGSRRSPWIAIYRVDRHLPCRAGHTGLPHNRYRWPVAMAGVCRAQGDLHGALDLLNQAERLYIRGFSPEVRPIPAFKARVWVALGRLDEALGWARESDLSVEDDLSYLREFEHITLAKVLLAQHTTARPEGSLHEATRLLDRLLRAADDAARTGSVLEILVLQAIAHQAQGDIPAALASLHAR